MEEGATGVYIQRSGYLDRWVRLGVASRKVIAVGFPATEPEASGGNHHPVLERLEAYLDQGERDAFRDVEIGLTVPTDQRRVLESVREIPFGDEWTRQEVAERTPTVDADEDGVAVIREALGANPVPVLVPDHRVAGIPGSVDPDVRVALRDREGLD